MSLSRILAMMAASRSAFFVGTSSATNASNTSCPVTYAAGAAAGDLAIVLFTYVAGVTPLAFPSGYTVLANAIIESGTTQGIAVGYKVLTAGDIATPGNITPGSGGMGGGGAVMSAVYRGVTAITQKSVTANAAGNVVLTGYAPSAIGRGAFSIASDRDTVMSGTVSTTGWTNRATQQGSIYGIAVADNLQYFNGNVTWAGFNNAASRVEGGALYELT